MPSLRQLGYLALHPNELRHIIQWKLWHESPHARDPDKEPESLKKCFHYLKQTSRSFSAVILELHPELLVAVSVFYLILRGLDTIEDDMTIPLEVKQPLLKEFDKVLEADGWTFDDCGPNEKDRDLLVEFHYVITEFKKLKPAYKVIIKDITQKMGSGMAHYAADAELSKYGVITIQDYYKYCHYVAGVVGEGLTRLFVEAGLANEGLLKREDLHESMGQFLQHINIIRDVREDNDDKRRFWPKEVWSKHVNNFDDLFKPENKEAALRCSSEMIMLALERVPDCMYYLAGLKEQSVFNFCAIPQAMAIATLDLCFRNPNLFERNIKITKGEACRLMMASSQNLQILFGEFRNYARAIHKKNDPRDPNFLKISVACGKIEQFAETIFPSQHSDALTVAANGEKREPYQSAEDAARRRREDAEAKQDVFYMGIAIGIVLLIVLTFMAFCAWMAGARLDLVLHFILQGNLNPSPEQIKAADDAMSIARTVPKLEL